MRQGKERDQRPDAAAQAEHRVPLHPVAMVGDRRHREADHPDAPHRHAGGERVPEEAMCAFPLPSPPQHHDAGAGRQEQEQGVGDHGPGERISAQERAGAQVHGCVRDPEDQVWHYYCLNYREKAV
jgi:hypothetical protein